MIEEVRSAPDLIKRVFLVTFIKLSRTQVEEAFVAAAQGQPPLAPLRPALLAPHLVLLGLRRNRRHRLVVVCQP